MDKQLFHNILNTLDHLKDKELNLIKEIHILKTLLKHQNYDLNNVGSSGIIIFGSNKTLAELIKPQYKDINSDKMQTIFLKLEKNNLIWRLTRQLQEDIGDNKKERKGFPTAFFILPTYKEYQAELFNKLKNNNNNLDQIIARMLWLSNAGFEDQKLRDKVLTARNYSDKNYKTNIKANLQAIRNSILPKKVVNHIKNKKVVKIKQLEYKDKGKVKLLH
tara:strand:- start:27 stop:683 length:657 start_codon:yes stop_codon:yes gene_type:complete